MGDTELMNYISSVGSLQMSGDLEFVVDTVTRNYSGFPDKVTPENEETYIRFTEALRVKYARADSLSGQMSLVREWIGFFSDLHLSISSDHLAATGGNNPSIEPWVEMIDDDTSLVRIPSFLPEWLETVHEVIAAHHDEIARRRNMIIDLRGNGGGSDDGMEILLPYIQSGPIEVVGADVRSSIDNAAYLRRLMQMHDFPDETRRIIEERATEMERNPDRFIEWVPSSMIEFGDVMETPGRVGLVVDRGCASSTEQLLLLARQSAKTVIFGEKTAGCIDYSNVVSVDLPSGEGTLNYPITRSKRVGVAPIDGVGISPDVAVDTRSETLFVDVARVLASR